MAEQKPVRRIKTTVFLDVETHTKLAGAAALAGMDRSAFAAAAIRDAVSSIVLFDRKAGQRKRSGRADPDDQAIQGIGSAPAPVNLHDPGELADEEAA
jgi:hypothetical protein